MERCAQCREECSVGQLFQAAGTTQSEGYEAKGGCMFLASLKQVRCAARTYCAVLTRASAEACMRCADVHVQKVAALLEQVNALRAAYCFESWDPLVYHGRDGAKSGPRWLILGPVRSCVDLLCRSSNAPNRSCACATRTSKSPAQSNPEESKSPGRSSKISNPPRRQDETNMCQDEAKIGPM